MRLLLTVSIIAALGNAPMAKAADYAIEQDANTYSYFVIRQPVIAFLNQLERDAQVRIDMSSRVDGQVGGLRASGTVTDVLDIVARKHGLQWFEFNGTYHISAADEELTRLVPLPHVSAETGRKVLIDIGFDPDRFPVTARDNMLILTGPPRLLAIAEATLAEAKEPQPKVAAPRAWKPLTRIVRQPAPVRNLTLYRGLSRTVYEYRESGKGSRRR
jgi:hypothetical protein